MSSASSVKRVTAVSQLCLSHHRRPRSFSCRSYRDKPQLVDSGNSSKAFQLGYYYQAKKQQSSTADEDESARSQRTISRSSLRMWFQYLFTKRLHFDVQAMTRILSSLHVDIPKILPQRILMRMMSRTKAEEIKKDDGDTDTVDAAAAASRINVMGDKSTVIGGQSNDIRNIDSGNIHKKEHEFVRATSTHETVEAIQSDRSEKTNDFTTDFQRAVVANAPPVAESKPTVGQQEKASLSGVKTPILQGVVVAKPGVVERITSYIPLIGAYSKKPEPVKPTLSVASTAVVDSLGRRVLVDKSSIDRRTRALVISLREAKTNESQLVRLEELCRHLAQHPDARNVVAREDKAIPCLLRLRANKNDVALRESATEALALMGFSNPVERSGIRILSLDGGGTKGLIAIEIMKRLEEITHQRIHELFDYVCGVSTGALIAIMAVAFRFPLDEIERLYKEFSSQMFARNKLVGAGKLFMSHAYYDTGLWEEILKQNIGLKSFLETTRDTTRCPKISTVSTLMNVSRVQNFLFRNYNLPPGCQSHYAGSLQHKLWESIRASSAAPGYFEEFQLGEYVHQDGGLLTNNPAAIAIHESQLLWPGETLQCVVSIGTGKYETVQEVEPVSKSSLKTTVEKVIQSATDTEAVHTVIHDLMKPSAYFRFNPYMSEQFFLDEIRVEKWNQMKQDTEMYCRKNEIQIQLAAQRLVQPRPGYKKAADWLRLKLAMIGQQRLF